MSATQASLFDTQPVIPTVDPHLTREDARALKGNNAKLLAYLEAHHSALATALIPIVGMRVAARVHDVNSYFRAHGIARHIRSGRVAGKPLVFFYALLEGAK